MADTIRILVILAEHADRRLVESALEDEPSLEVVGYADYLDDWRAVPRAAGRRRRRRAATATTTA